MSARPTRRLARDVRGFTIVETMVAIVIIGFAFLGVAGVHGVSSRAQSLGQNQGLARFVTDQELEEMRRLPFDQIVSGSSSATVEGVAFNVNRDVQAVANGARVTVTTTWTDRFGPQTMTFTTIVSQVTNPASP
ncbi:MAG: prepilin-type N-terminal cleavage/methylation domain-containing protein [Thermodesulfobacteriota bacterium]